MFLTLPTYSFESWITFWNHICQLDIFHKQCLHTIFVYNLENKLSNINSFSKCHIWSLEIFLMHFYWVGLVLHMCDEITQNCMMVFRNWEDPLLRYKDKLKQNLNSIDIHLSSFEEVASESCQAKEFVHIRHYTFWEVKHWPVAKQSTEHIKVTAASTRDAVPRPV